MNWFDEAMGQLNEIERATLLARADEIREEADKRIAKGIKPSQALVDICREIIQKEGYSLSSREK